MGRYITLGLILAVMIGCSNKEALQLTEKDVVVAWTNMALYITRNTPSNSPTYASRCFGYFGVAMYESVVKSEPDFESLSGQLNGFNLQIVPEKNKSYKWILSLNAAQADILRNLYVQSSEVNVRKIDSLENYIRAHFSANVDEQEVLRSVAYGQSVAQAVFEWSKTDGGHRGYLNNFDKKFSTVQGKGHWEPPLYGQSFSHFPLHPHWGNNRTFLVEDHLTPVPPIIPFDSTPGSPYYEQHLAVYKQSKALTLQEKEAALWWGDDPSDTFTPPGHSIYLTNLVVQSSNLSLVQCAQTYASVGMGVADAFILCWRWKYHYCSERPSSFITRYIDKSWESFWPDPPFPAFPSGHAIQAGTTSAVLAELFGDRFDIRDVAHVGRSIDELRNVGFTPRTFASFSEIAKEVAASRFYGGIHSQQDNETGLAEGKCIAQHIKELRWKKSSAYVNVVAAQ